MTSTRVLVALTVATALLAGCGLSAEGTRTVEAAGVKVMEHDYLTRVRDEVPLVSDVGDRELLDIADEICKENDDDPGYRDEWIDLAYEYDEGYDDDFADQMTDLFDIVVESLCPTTRQRSYD